MKRIILPLFLIMLFTAAELPAFTGDKFGRPLTLTELTNSCHGDDRPDCPILDGLAKIG